MNPVRVGPEKRTKTNKESIKTLTLGAVWPAGEKLVVNPADWKVKLQRSSKRGDSVNDQIDGLKAHLKEILRRQLDNKTVATTESVIYEYENGEAPQWTGKGWSFEVVAQKTAEKLTGESSLVMVYTRHIADLKVQYGNNPTRPQQVDIGRWERGLRLLLDYQTQTETEVPVCNRITLKWLNGFHAWLQTQQSDKQANKISSPMASRYIGKIGQVLQEMVEDELITHNAVRKKSWPRYEDKEINFIEPEQVKTLFGLHWRGTKGVALWWFLLMCCTGLDYPDAVAYVKNRSSLERCGPAGIKLLGKRKKKPYEDFDVPLLDEVEVLFTRQPGGAKKLADGVVNRYTDQIEDVLGIDWRITAKTARKTFGCLMLINGFMVSEVSRMMGHTRVTTTEKYYVKFIGTGVDRARLRVGKSSLL